MLIGLVRTRVKRLKDREPWRPMFSLRNFVSGMMVYGATPATMLYFWYTHRDWMGLADKMHLALFISSTILAFVSYGMAVSMLEGWGVKEIGEVKREPLKVFRNWYAGERGKWYGWLGGVWKQFRVEKAEE
jgi:hypothetical protein